MGIALAGWDRLGWGGSPAEIWMRLHDRRALLSAVVLVAAYAGLVAMVLLQGLALLRLIPATSLPAPLPVLLSITFAFLCWRMAVRMLFVHRAYGAAEALRSVPRMVIANIIAMMAARRAFMIYLRLWAGGTLRWDKTAHRFPGIEVPDKALEPAP